MMEQDRAFKGPDVVRFLEHALRQIGGKLIIIWDGSPIHCAKQGRLSSFWPTLAQRLGCSLNNWPVITLPS